MKAIRRALARLRAGERRCTAPAFVLSACMLTGYVGATAHTVEHFGEPQAESLCQLCIAGDQFTPIPRAATASIPHAAAAQPSLLFEVSPAIRRLPVLHGVRAPPLTA